MNAIAASSAHLAYPDRIVSKILLSSSRNMMKGLILGQEVILCKVSMANAATNYSGAPGNRNVSTIWSMPAALDAVGGSVCTVAGDLVIIWTTKKTPVSPSSNNP